MAQQKLKGAGWWYRAFVCPVIFAYDNLLRGIESSFILTKRQRTRTSFCNPRSTTKQFYRSSPPVELFHVLFIVRFAATHRSQQWQNIRQSRFCLWTSSSMSLISSSHVFRTYRLHPRRLFRLCFPKITRSLRLFSP